MSGTVANRWTLSLTESGGGRRTVAIDSFPFHVGRAPENELQLNHLSVSRRHARIDRESDALIIEDLGSQNHVYVNDARVARGRIRDGDRLVIGIFELEVSRGPVAAGRGVAVSPDPTNMQTQFFEPKASWDPLGAFSTALSRFESIRSGVAVSPDWQKLLRFALVDQRPYAYDRILQVVSEFTCCERAFLILFDRESPENARLAARHVVKGASQRRVPDIFLSREIVRRVAETKEAVIVSREQSPDLANRMSFIGSGASSALCLPLLAGDVVLGVLYLDTAPGQGHILRNDCRALVPVAGLLALKVENIRLQHERLRAQLDRKELDIAKTVQEGLYPTEPASIRGFSVDGFTRACYEVGGDFFDFHSHDDGSLTCLLGDVSGKGLSAALYSVGVLSTLRAHLRDGLGLATLMRKLELYVRESFRSDYFLTFLIGQLNPTTGVFSYCNAGHVQPIVFKKDGSIVELDCPDPALNIFPWEDFTVCEYELEVDDVLLAFTDGLFECERADRDRYGMERAIDFVRKRRTAELSVIRREILAELETYSAPRGLNDDITLILVRRK